MKWLLLSVVLLSGCLAEGDIEETDVGTDIGNQNNFNSFNNLNNLNNASDMSFFDGGYEFGEACDPFAQDCSAAGKCVPNPATSEATCLIRGEERGQGQPCETITQCASGTHCASVPDDSTNLCRVMCNPNGADTCPAGDTCSVRLTSVPNVGVCVAAQLECNIYTQDCASGTCIVTSSISNGDDGTYCGSPGTVAAEAACGNGRGDCQASMICVQLAGAPAPTCQHVCRIGTLQCPAGELSCIGQSTSTGVTFCKIP